MLDQLVKERDHLTASSDYGFNFTSSNHSMTPGRNFYMHPIPPSPNSYNNITYREAVTKKLHKPVPVPADVLLALTKHKMKREAEQDGYEFDDEAADESLGLEDLPAPEEDKQDQQPDVEMTTATRRTTAAATDEGTSAVEPAAPSSSLMESERQTTTRIKATSAASTGKSKKRQKKMKVRQKKEMSRSAKARAYQNAIDAFNQQMHRILEVDGKIRHPGKREKLFG
ncbi:unnamed protein product [Amoebophrya sp. A120]|nr:unnamed protein product [Amoebophrya sp. A120]|eukprot:GSA120T00012200001.1